MTPEQVDLVEWSVTALGPRLDEVVVAFYDRLFELDPATRLMFAGDLAAQRAKFASELAFMVTTIRRHDEFVAVAHHLGMHHDDLGVRPRHFRTAGVALLDALAATLGDAWTPAVRDAWRLAYGITAELMMAGAARRRH